MQKSLFDYRAFRRRGEDEANFGEESRPAHRLSKYRQEYDAIETGLQLTQNGRV
jgi:hypothetical protein